MDEIPNSSRKTNQNEPSVEGLTVMLRSGLAEAMQALAASYSIPVCWISSVDGKPHIHANGTAFMLDCSHGPFLVTARHVFQAYLGHLLAHPDLVCLLGASHFDLNERLIAEDKGHDVATFRLTAEDVQHLQQYGKHVLTGSQASWPPQPPQVGRGVFFVGFPGDGRSMRPYRGHNLVEVDWIGYTALAVADSVSDTSITLVVDPVANVDIGLAPRVPPEWALGGCSGAPLLTFVENAGVHSWRLGGVIYEAGSLFLKASRADCLNADGTINPHPDLNIYRPGRE